MSDSSSALSQVRSHDRLLSDEPLKASGMSSSKNGVGAHGLVRVEEPTSRGTDVPLEERDIHRATRNQEYRVYKRRFFGLIQLILLNIIVSWDVCSILPFP